MYVINSHKTIEVFNFLSESQVYTCNSEAVTTKWYFELINDCNHSVVKTEIIFC